MADVQVENGFTRIANELLDRIYKTDFNATQLRILLCIIRYTYGFKRKEHEMSVGFISKGTGISRRYISSELKKLIARKVVLILREHNETTSRVLSLNKNYEQWLNKNLKHQMNNASPDEQKQDTTGEQLFSTTGEEHFTTTDEQSFSTTDEELFTQERNNKENIKENTKGQQFSLLTEQEAEVIETLMSVDKYPLDRQKDIEMYHNLKKEFPELDILAVIKDWAVHKLDRPLQKNSSPRSQIKNSCKLNLKWNKNLKSDSEGNKNLQPLLPQYKKLGNNDPAYLEWLKGYKEQNGGAE